MTATLTHPTDITTIETLTTDQLPPPRGEGRGEGLGEPLAPALGAAGFNPRSPALPPRRDAASESSAFLMPGPRSLVPSLLNRLLTLYTTHSNSFSNLCRELDMSMLELLDLLEHPDVTRALERLAHASEARAKTLARLTSDSAVSALIDLMDTTDKPETRRKAAGAILRHSKPPAKSAKRATDSDAAAPEKSVTRQSVTGKPPPPRGEGRGEGLAITAARSPQRNRTGAQAARGAHQPSSQAA